MRNCDYSKSNVISHAYDSFGRGIDSIGMVFREMQDFLPAFADFSRGFPYDFTHVALTLPLGGAPQFR